MTRYRTESATPQLTVRNHSGPTPAASSPPASSNMQSQGSDDKGADTLNKNLPSIRFITHNDPRAPRPSLQFPTITRTLPDETVTLRVGRYSERDNTPEPPSNAPSAAPVGFKSKVVSRKHCELWCKDGNWFIKDVKSSSGTFLNHIRLSQPNVESKPFRLKDGDIIQLGIDFRGGEEMIFRCVKIRIECNRGWQQALNTFNKQTHQRLRNLGKSRKDGDNASMHSSECSICLMSIAPCQSLFVAPCSHVWHYKCIRPILNGSTWPNFLCPNCRAVADLEADVEDMGEFETWDDDAPASGDAKSNDPDTQDRQVTPKSSTHLALPDISNGQQSSQPGISDIEAAIANIQLTPAPTTASATNITTASAAVPSTPQPLQSRNASSPAVTSSVTQPVSINILSANEAGLSPLYHNTSNGLSPDHGGAECPMTPRNDAGPFVLDGSGSAGRAAAQGILRARENGESNTGPDGAPLLPPINVD
ncbi:unnamed protein product [Periconia digitata]|uniref:RING-type E3 ubiquitin transferase n=1 Tax=Periconia digitata TaxID=1303443 RepID=A0A9W4XM65_9PLEO|nr:unnamed protein product [Periconia digitata]